MLVLSYAPPNAVPYVLIHRLANLHSCTLIRLMCKIAITMNAEQSVSQWELRLQRRRERDRARGQSESAQQHEEWLTRRRRAALSVEQRQLSLQRGCDECTAESTQEREVRLLEMSTHQRERLATELTEEREARLGDLSTRQHERLAMESAEERERPSYET